MADRRPCQFCGRSTAKRATLLWVPGQGNVKADLCPEHSKTAIIKSRIARGLNPVTGRREKQRPRLRLVERNDA